ncbi:hypothetical protein DITRI_Ditri15bG0054000 [Diplodiscus trichospermus]
MQEQFLKHFSLHCCCPKLVSALATAVSGTFSGANFTNPSPFFQIDALGFRTHPADQSPRNQVCGDLGSNPGKQEHSDLST